MITYKQLLQYIYESPIYDPVYHGSSNRDLTFGDPKTGRKKFSPKMQLDFGTHVTQDKDYATKYAKGFKKGSSKKEGRVYSGKLELKDPLDLTQGFYPKDHPDFDRVHSLAKHLKLKNSIGYDTEHGREKEPQHVTITQHHLDSKPPEVVHSALIKHGYDGIIYHPLAHSSNVGQYNKDPKSYIALHKSSLNLK
jgi:hypothetical protein